MLLFLIAIEDYGYEPLGAEAEDPLREGGVAGVPGELIPDGLVT
jgi:hypothetical protein